MAAATFTSTITKTRTSVGTTEVIWTITTTSTGDISIATSTFLPQCFDEGLPFGSAHLVVTSGSAPTSASLLVGNDGINANLVIIGVPHTAFPALVDVTSGQNAAVQTVAENLASMPHKFHSWQFIAIAGPSVVTITEIFMGTRG